MAEGMEPQIQNHIYPQRLLENHKRIYLLLKPLKNKEFDRASPEMDEIIKELQVLLNDSQPRTDEEHLLRRQVSLHFNKDRKGYYNHLHVAKLRFLVLWTNYTYISIYFNLNNKIHIKWVGTHYECELYDRNKRTKIQELDPGEPLSEITEESEP
jgi:hypothetical protein